MQDRVYSMLGLAAKAGRIVSGGFQTEKAIKEHKAKLVILAVDSGENTLRDIQNKCEFYKIPCCLYGEKEALGRAVGKADRSCVAVLDYRFAESIMKLPGIRPGAAEGFEGGGR